MCAQEKLPEDQVTSANTDIVTMYRHPSNPHFKEEENEADSLSNLQKATLQQSNGGVGWLSAMKE